MKIIVCGAGQVGSSIAKQLSIEGNDVAVIDSSAERIQAVSDTLDVQARIGFASHPTVLEEVGADSADMIIAVTLSDEINMVACQVANSLFNIPTKIARIRNQNYLNPEWMHLYKHDQLAIDNIISPEIEVAKAIVNRLHVPGAADTIPFANSKIKAIGIRCTLDCPMINMPLTKIQKKLLDINVSIMGLMRKDDFIIATNEVEFLEDDELYFICDTEYEQEAMLMFGYEAREARRIIIIGGGNIGLFLAEHLEKENDVVNIKLIEVNKDRAEFVADKLSKTTVINGSALSKEILEEASVSSAETVIAVTNDDEVNILSSLLAKKFGCERVLTLVNNSNSYSELVSSLGVDVTVNPREITISSILRHVREGRISAVHSICQGEAEIIEAEAVESSSIVGKSISNLDLPKDVKIGAIFREDQMLIPDMDTSIQAGDKVIVLSKANMVNQVEKIFSVNFEFY